MFPPKLVTGLISFYWRELLYNAVLVSDVQQSEPALRLPTSPLFWMSYRFRSLHRIEYRSLCNTVGSHYLIIYFIPALFFNYSVVSDSLRPHGLQHTRLPCPSPSPGACSN